MPQKQNKYLGKIVVGAIKTGQASFLDFLMMVGVSPDLKCPDGKTLTHHAAEYAVQTGDPEVLRRLVHYGANLNIRAKNGKTVIDILKAKPGLENEVRQAWLGGSGSVGIRDSRRGKKAREKKVLGGGGKKSEMDKNESAQLSSQILGQVSRLRKKKKQNPKKLKRPETKKSHENQILAHPQQEQRFRGKINP
jgi:hypothetical protein